MFNIITERNESKTLTKHISCACKCRFDARKYNSDQWWNNDKYWYECKKRHVCEKGYLSNHSICNFENGKYLANIMGKSAIMCNEIIRRWHKSEIEQ